MKSEDLARHDISTAMEMRQLECIVIREVCELGIFY
jgi:hypothetical protein